MLPDRCRCGCHDGTAAHVGPCRCVDGMLASRRSDPAYQERLARHVAEVRPVLDRLADH